MEDITDFMDFFFPTWKLQEEGWREDNLEKQTLIVFLNPALEVGGTETPSSSPPIPTPGYQVSTILLGHLNNKRQRASEKS